MASNVMELFAKIGLDQQEFDHGLDKAKGALSSFGSATAKIGTAALKATGVALAGAATTVVALTKSAYTSYSQYQQLIGGVDTLFGTEYKNVQEYAEGMGLSMDYAMNTWEQYSSRSETVMANAKNAYKTAGMSANQYMETVTSFAAALNSSLGENAWQSANYADVAIQDMSDNANKMGTSMESIKNAYMGFSKQNFTMLDNLKLGYGGTKTEMERLLRDAEELEGLKVGSYDVNNFADVVSAIHTIQENMRITGTTAAEADKTITGSFGSLKAAWDNLVTGFADPDADLGQLISDVVTTGTTAIKNAVPTIVNALKGIGQAVSELAPILAEELPSLIEDLLPPLLEAATSLVNTLASNAPRILDVLVQQIPKVLPAVLQAASQLISAVAEQLPTLIEMIGDVLIEEVPKLLTQLQKNASKFTSGLTRIIKTIGTIIVKLAPVIFPAMLEIGKELLKSLTDGISNNASDVVAGILEVLEVIINTLLDPNTLLTILNCGLQILLALIQGLADNMDKVMDLVFNLVENIIAFFVLAIPDLVAGIGKAGATIVTEVIPKIILKLGEKFGDILYWLLGEDGILGWIPKIVEGAKELGSSIWNGMWDGLYAIWETIKGVGGKIIGWMTDGITEGFTTLFEWGAKIGSKILEGIKSMWGALKDAVNPKNWFNAKGASTTLKEMMEEAGVDSADGYVEGQEKGFDIHSPSKKMAYIGRMVMAGFNKGVEEEEEPMVEKISVDAISAEGVKSNGSVFDEQSGQISAMMSLLSQLMSQEQEIVVPVYIGGHQIDEIIVDSKQRVAVRSGGQVDA